MKLIILANILWQSNTININNKFDSLNTGDPIDEYVQQGGAA